MTERKFEQSPEEKAYWQAAAARRKEVAIRRGRWAVEMDEKAIVSCHELFTSWCAAYGKERAVDCLVEALVEEHFLLLDRENYKSSQPKIKWRKTSGRRQK